MERKLAFNGLKMCSFIELESNLVNHSSENAMVAGTCLSTGFVIKIVRSPPGFNNSKMSVKGNFVFIDSTIILRHAVKVTGLG